MYIYTMEYYSAIKKNEIWSFPVVAGVAAVAQVRVLALEISHDMSMAGKKKKRYSSSRDICQDCHVYVEV